MLEFSKPKVWCKTEKQKTITIIFWDITWKINADGPAFAGGPNCKIKTYINIEKKNKRYPVAYFLSNWFERNIIIVYNNEVMRKKWKILLAKNICSLKTISDGLKPVPIKQIEPPIAKNDPIIANE